MFRVITERLGCAPDYQSEKRDFESLADAKAYAHAEDARARTTWVTVIEIREGRVPRKVDWRAN